MVEIDLTAFDFSNDRSEFRNELVNLFLEEKPGTGKGENTSRYNYITKNLEDGRVVYLRRPAQFNNGFDFTLNVSETNFNLGIAGKRSTTRPSHHHIITDLRNKREENEELFNLLFEQINRLYACQDLTEDSFDFHSGHPTALILECIKWLFAEQDVTYWNYSGRAMFYGTIKEI